MLKSKIDIKGINASGLLTKTTGDTVQSEFDLKNVSTIPINYDVFIRYEMGGVIFQQAGYDDVLEPGQGGHYITPPVTIDATWPSGSYKVTVTVNNMGTSDMLPGGYAELANAFELIAFSYGADVWNVYAVDPKIVPGDNNIIRYMLRNTGAETTNYYTYIRVDSGSWQKIYGPFREQLDSGTDDEMEHIINIPTDAPGGMYRVSVDTEYPDGTILDIEVNDNAFEVIAPARVYGHVIDSILGTPIPLTVVKCDTTGAQAITDSNGTYNLDPLMTGMNIPITASVIGYASKTGYVDYDGVNPSKLDFPLKKTGWTGWQSIVGTASNLSFSVNRNGMYLFYNYSDNYGRGNGYYELDSNCTRVNLKSSTQDPCTALWTVCTDRTFDGSSWNDSGICNQIVKSCSPGFPPVSGLVVLEFSQYIGESPPPPPPGLIFGYVHDSETGFAIQGATITLKNSSTGAVVETKTTSISGYYEFKNKPTGGYGIETSHPDYYTEGYSFAYTSGETIQIGFSMTAKVPQAKIWGYITDSIFGWPVPFAIMKCLDSGVQTSADANGIYYLDPLITGIGLQIQSSHINYQTQIQTVAFDGYNSVRLDFKMIRI